MIILVIIWWSFGIFNEGNEVMLFKKWCFVWFIYLFFLLFFEVVLFLFVLVVLIGDLLFEYLFNIVVVLLCRCNIFLK